jgi:hypothetical protein
MSFINGLLDFTVSISYQPSCTVTHKGSRSHVYEINTRPGCGTLAGPSLEWVAFRLPRPNGFAECPSLERPGVLGRPKMPGSGVLKRKSPVATAAEYMTCLYQTYTYHLCLLSKICFSRQCVMSLRLALKCICTYWTRHGNFVIISSVKMQLIEKHKNLDIYQKYVRLIQVIYHCCLEHQITLEKIITTYVKTHFV